MATFTHEIPYGNATSVQYNDASTTYGSTTVTYGGKTASVFTHETKSP